MQRGKKGRALGIEAGTSFP